MDNEETDREKEEERQGVTKRVKKQCEMSRARDSKREIERNK